MREVFSFPHLSSTYSEPDSYSIQPNRLLIRRYRTYHDSCSTIRSILPSRAIYLEEVAASDSGEMILLKT